MRPYINVYKGDIIHKHDWIDIIVKHFNVENLEVLGLKDRIYSIISTGKLIDYLYSTQKDSLEHINRLQFYNPADYMILDINTRENLEIHHTIMGREKKGALIWVLDKTSTAMGGRLLKNWLEQPLLDIKEIEKRQEIVELFVNNPILMDEVKECLKKIYDLERLIGKISYGNCNARDLSSLKISIGIIPKLKDILLKSNDKLLVELGMKIDTLEDIYDLIDKSIVDDPPISVREGGLIKLGYDEELDVLKKASIDGKKWLADLEAEERKKTGIKSLKIGFNKNRLFLR